ncbi:MAG: glycosyltransferase [Patescibacteria group bacterium]
MQKRLISIVTPCYCEEKNVVEVSKRVAKVFKILDKYEYEHIFIDNCSPDGTVKILKGLAAQDKHIKLILNAKNFGHIRSPFYGLLQAKGDAVILLVSDLQDPPEMIIDLIKKWEEGFKIVIGTKNKSEESPVMFALRKLYYGMIKKISETEHIKNFTGFGLYDQKFIEVLRQLDDPYPYFRGLVAELGFERAEINYTQPKRKRGKTNNNFYTLYDIGMLGFVNHSKVPIRIASFIGFCAAIASLLIAVGYLIYKIMFWDRFDLGTAPMVIGLFFFASVQLFFIGIIGEYIGAIFTQVRNRPLVIERERVNFDKKSS